MRRAFRETGALVASMPGQSMPPFRRYMVAYLIGAVALITLIALGAVLTRRPSIVEEHPQIIVFYAGIWVAVLSFLAATWSQWKTATIQHAMSALQLLRTDREYLINAGVIQPRMNVARPIRDADVERIIADRAEPYQVGAPNFGQAAVFVLNQYEFVAAAAMAGALDRHMLRQTIRSVILRLGLVFGPFIRRIRADNPRFLANFVRLHGLMAETAEERAVDLGPQPPRT
ncbi:MAG: DUF4760 domain-containing protein [Rubrimonas sp.]